MTDFVSQPSALAFVVAFLAGVVGVLSLTSAKSGALIGVLISVTTIPAAGNIGLASAYGNWEEAAGAVGQLSLNLGAIMLAGTLTLIQRRLYMERLRRHRRRPEPGSAGSDAAGGWHGARRGDPARPASGEGTLG